MRTKFMYPGKSAEFYFNSLMGWNLNHHKDGTRTPDFTTKPGFLPDGRLCFEVKSGTNRKGMLVDYELHYGIPDANTYEKVFGVRQKRQQEFLFDTANTKYGHPLYYVFINRLDATSQRDYKSKSLIPLIFKFGDIYIVPHEFIIKHFIVNRFLREGGIRSLEELSKHVLDKIKADIDNNNGGNRRCTHTAQNFNASDIPFLFDETGIRNGSVNRLSFLREIYPEVDTLERVQFVGPNNSEFYCLIKSKDVENFKTIEETIQRRIPIIEDLSRKRVNAFEALSHIENLMQWRE